MRNWKRILAGAGSAALLLSSVGVVSRTAFAAEPQTESTEDVGKTEEQAAAVGAEADDSSAGSQSSTGDATGKTGPAAGADGNTADGDETGHQTGTEGTGGTDEAGTAGEQNGQPGATGGTEQNGQSGTSGEPGTAGQTGTEEQNEQSDTVGENDQTGTTGQNGLAGDGQDTSLIDLEPDSSDNAIDLASISGSTTVQVGDNIQLSCSDCRYGSTSRSWSVSDESIATLSNTTNSRVSLTGIKRGTVTVTHYHRYYDYYNGRYVEETDTMDVVVTGNEERAQVYAQATPSSDAGSNSSSEWTPLIGNATICVDDAVWDSGNKNTTGTSSGESATAFMVSWPDGSTGGTWNLVNDLDYNDGDYFDMVWGYIESAYESALSTKLGIPVPVNKDNVKSIVLTPYKVSRNNGTNPDKHVDCTITVTLERQYTVQFNVKEVGEGDYQMVHTDQAAYTMTLKNYVGEAEPVAEYIYEYTDGDGNVTQYKIGDTRVDPDTGTTYKFTGWYKENAQGAARSDDLAVFENGYYHPKTETTVDSDNNTVTKLPELTDYVLNLYAEWVPVTGDLKVTKNVDATSGYYDPDAKYQIKIHLDGAAGKTYGNYAFDGNGDCIVTLAGSESVTIPEIPSGTQYTVDEVATSATGFTVSYDEAFYQYGDDGSRIDIADATAGTIYPEGIAEVTVKNEKKIVLTGVRTTDTPMAAILVSIVMAIMGITAYHKAQQYMY